MEKGSIKYTIAETPADFDKASILFREYAQSLGIDLSFQDFEEELMQIGRQYNKPKGVLLLANSRNQPIGCIAVRQLDEETAELKRMYVQPAYRGYGIGAELLKRALATAKGLGYKKIRLDTLANMAKAQEIYRAFGFYAIPSYRYNPLEGTVYMEKAL